VAAFQTSQSGAQAAGHVARVNALLAREMPNVLVVKVALCAPCVCPPPSRPLPLLLPQVVAKLQSRYILLGKHRQAGGQAGRQVGKQGTDPSFAQFAFFFVVVRAAGAPSRRMIRE